MNEHLTYEPRDIAEYNPSDLANLVRYCVQELMNRTAYPLALPGPFDGAGIYALFYDGDFVPYQHLAIRSADFRRPIYVGRARFTKSSGPRPLFKRLRDHAKSIDAVENLRIDHFRCRFLVLHPLWVSTVEDLLIQHYSTLWNDVIKGFGLHAPGGKRLTGEVSMWDMLHPGRSHQKEMVAGGARGMTSIELLQLIERYTLTFAPLQDSMTPNDVQEIIRSTVEDDDTAER